MMSIVFCTKAMVDNPMTQNLSSFTNKVVLGEIDMGVVFRTNQNLCCGSDQLILYKSGNFELYQKGIEVYSGTYIVDSENKVVVLNVDGTKLRCKYQLKNDGQNISYLTFGNDIYRPCNK